MSEHKTSRRHQTDIVLGKLRLDSFRRSVFDGVVILKICCSIMSNDVTSVDTEVIIL